MVVCCVVCWAASDATQGFVYFPGPRSAVLVITTVQQQLNIYGYSDMFNTPYVVFMIFSNYVLNYN
jgi:hypothetical protein